ANPPDATRFEPDGIFPLVLDGMHFSYGHGADMLRRLSLAISPGTITLIRGSSGSGKSTLLSLLLRQYVPSMGRIQLGIHPIELVSHQTLHRHIAIVPQRVQLVDDTFVANVCLGEAPDLGRLE